MSTAVLELKEKVERLTPEERADPMQILEENAPADKAEVDGDWTSFDALKKELGCA